MTSYLNIPWPGMEEDACIFLDGGRGCQDKTARRSLLEMPVKIEELYPEGLFPIKYTLFQTEDDGEKQELFCLIFKLRILWP